MNNIDEIKARVDIVDLVSETVNLRKSGRNYSGFCPFHDNKRTPAFAVFPESGTWRCFDQCNEGGDIFKFVMKKEGWDFPEALRSLADRAGVRLRELTPREQRQKEEHERLRDLLEHSLSFFRHSLMKTETGRSALDYLQSRGLKEKTIEKWGLGFAPDSWDACRVHLAQLGYDEAEMVAAGMLSQRDDGRTYDRFRNRITFAIRDERGRMAGFGARTLDPDGIPKYLNSPQTDIFDKGSLLYGMDQARRTIRAEDQAVVVEGYMDVIALHQAGFTHAVSPMGTALTEAQLQLIKRRTGRIILALDADAAGNTATMRGLNLARQTLDRETEVAFDPRGLMRQEARLKADIRVTTLPEGRDPDEVVREDPEAWQRILDGARPVVVHVMETLAAGKELEDAKVKSEIAAQVLPLIRDIPSAIERDTYRQRLARLIRVDERALLDDPSTASRPRRRPRRPQPAQVAPPQPSVLSETQFGTTQALEVFTLGVLMRHPDYLYRLDRALQKANLHRLSAHDFQDTGHQNLMRVIRKATDQDFDVPHQVVIASLSLSLHDQADSILEATADLEANPVRTLEDLLRAVLDLRRRQVNRNIAHLRFLMEDAQEKGELIVGDYQQSMMQHTTTLVRLDKALRQTHDRTILNG